MVSSGMYLRDEFLHVPTVITIKELRGTWHLFLTTKFDLKKRRKSDTANYLPKDLNDSQHTQFSAMNLCPPPATPLRRPPYDHVWNPFIWEQIWN